MRARFTKFQVARNAHCDVDQPNYQRFIIFKACSTLGLTYQIAKLTEEAIRRRIKLRIQITQQCILQQSLRDHCNTNKRFIALERFKFDGSLPVHF